MGRRSRDDPTVAGVLLIDKPAGVTSHDAVGRVRRAVGVRRVGHSGTLDPAATGLLIIGVGWVTRVLRFTGAHAKTYRGRVVFGVETDTCDAQGETIETASMSVDRDQLDAALAGFVGEIDQVPPAHSAIKVGGEKLYEKARRGEKVDADPRRVTIHSLDVVEASAEAVVLDVSCSSGTYIRSLARDLGRDLGGVAHLGQLRRTAIGPHHVDDAISFDALADLGRSALEPSSLAVAGLETVSVDADTATRVLAGGHVEFGSGAGPVGVLGPGAELLGVYEFEDGRPRAACVAPREAIGA